MDMADVGRIFQFFQFYLGHRPTEPEYLFILSVACNLLFQEIFQTISSVVKNSENNTQMLCVFCLIYSNSKQVYLYYHLLD